MTKIIEDVRKSLKELSDETTKQGGQRFFKEHIKMYGVKAPEVKKISKDYFKTIKEKPKKEIFELCEELWQSGYVEESMIACHWSYALRKKFEPSDIEIFEKWVKLYVNNWAACDTLCNHTIGSFIDRYPDYLGRLKTWAKSDNRWLCRAAAVSLIVPARDGKFLNDIFEIADILLLHPDDLVQKGYGWMLKAACKNHEKAVYEYVFDNKAVMPRTALRYAIEKMTADLKASAMKK